MDALNTATTIEMAVLVRNIVIAGNFHMSFIFAYFHSWAGTAKIKPASFSEYLAHLSVD